MHTIGYSVVSLTSAATGLDENFLSNVMAFHGSHAEADIIPDFSEVRKLADAAIEMYKS